MKILSSNFFTKIAAFLTVFFLTSPLFAQAIPRGMETAAEQILAIFRSRLITIILAIFLSGAAIAYAFNKDNEKIKRNAIAIIIGAVIIIVAQQAVEFIQNATGA